MAAPFALADNLRSRTFLGLLVAQFLAAFNDQAIHASAMFFAIKRGTLTEAQAITLMPILFYAPWALFCTLAGYLADRFSKQRSLIFWKVAEVAITLLTLAGFWYGNQGKLFGPWLVLSTVFLMGMHSAFFVPAKYGAMPEILTGRMLSRGNGLLESLSFLAVILGTVSGGILSTWFSGQEEVIGMILVALAVIGAVASLLIQHMPAAYPKRPFPPYLFGPLYTNIRAMVLSRPLSFALIGIAFFTFMVAFMRSTVYMFGQAQVPSWTESQTSILVGMVALGIGFGSPLVGYLSGGKVEVGMVPIGALGMMTATILAAFMLDVTWALFACVIGIGFFTGFYLVPLFTLLQQRAPKTSKGDTIATSNFINVVGAILASGMFFLVNFVATRGGLVSEVPQHEDRPRTLLSDPQFEEGRPHRVVLGKHHPHEYVENEDIEDPEVIMVGNGNLIDVFKEPLKKGDHVIHSTYQIGTVHYHSFRRDGEPLRPAYDKRPLPTYLFLGAGLLTFVTLVLLRLRWPDLFLRTRLWLRWLGRVRIEAAGVTHVPGSGSVILATDCQTLESSLQVLAVIDRTTRFLVLRSPQEAAPNGLARCLASTRGLGILMPSAKEPIDWQRIRREAGQALAGGGVVALPLVDAPLAKEIDQTFDGLIVQAPIPILPIHCATGGPGVVYVFVGPALPGGTPAVEVRRALRAMVDQLHPGRISDTGTWSANYMERTFPVPAEGSASTRVTPASPITKSGPNIVEGV